MRSPLFGLPEKYFPFAACAHAETILTAFDRALQKTNISDYNLVKVSSIIPPGARESRPDLPKGSLLPVAYGVITSDREGAFISAAVAVGFPEDPTHVGVIMEFSGYVDIREAEEIAKKMAREALLNRGSTIREIKVFSAGTEVRRPTCAIAGVALW